MNSVNNSSPPIWLSIMAGSAGQVSEILLGGHVLNRIATEQQAHPERGNLFKTIRYLYGKNGIREFYSGIRWNIGMGCCKGATRWGLNNAMFEFFGKHIPKQIQDNHSWILPATVGIGGAAFETTVYLCPGESLRTQEMTGAKDIVKVIRKEGISICFRGWDRLFYRQAITWMNYLVVYDKLRQKALEYRKGGTLSKTDKFVLNALTGVSASLINVPFDMLRTQAQKVDPLKEKRTIKAFVLVYQEQGFRSIYLSLPIRMTRSVFYAVVTFTVMDYFDGLPKRMKL